MGIGDHLELAEFVNRKPSFILNDFHLRQCVYDINFFVQWLNCIFAPRQSTFVDSHQIRFLYVRTIEQHHIAKILCG